MISLCIRRPLSRRVLPFLILIGLSVTVISCGGNEQSSARVARVQTAVAVSAAGAEDANYPGRVVAHKEVSASFRVAGPIVRVLVQQGDYVQKGQLLAELDGRDYQVQLSAVESEYAQAAADASRIEALYKEGATTASMYDQARYGMAQLSEKLANCRNQLADTRLCAPVSGYVREVLHEGGEMVGAGTPVLTLSDDGDLEVEISVPSSDLALIEGLQGATAEIDGKAYALHVVSVSKTGGASGRYPVRFGFAESEVLTGQAGRPQGSPLQAKAVAVGMTAMVSIQTEAVESDGGEVLVPVSAVACEGEESYVWVVADSVVHRRVVVPRVVHRDGTMGVTGLVAGEVVVSAGVHSLSEKLKVKSEK